MKFRNISGEPRFVVELGRVVDDDELFTVPDDRADAYDEQPYFTADQPASRTKNVMKAGD